MLRPVVPHAQRDKRLIRRQQRPRKRIPPIYTQPRTRDLHPALDVAHHGQLPGKDFAQQQVNPGDTPFLELLLNQRHGMRITLASQRAENQAPALRLARRLHRLPTDRLHLIVLVLFAGELARVRVVAVRGDGRVVNHDALEVEAAVAEVQDEVDVVLVAQARGRAAENLALAEGRNLGHEDAEARGLEGAAHAVDGGVELDGAHEGDRLAAGKVALERRQQVRRVDANVDKDVQRLDLGHVDGDQAAVRVVHQHVAAQRPRRVVVYAARAVGDVAHDERLDAWAKLRQDVGDGGGEEEKALGHLQRNLGRARGADAVDGFGDLEAVVGRKQRDRFLEVGVLGDFGRYPVEKPRRSSWFGGWSCESNVSVCSDITYARK